jgi:thiamine kinase-like enzyme
MPPTLESLLARVPGWQDVPLTTQVLSGGITNLNYRVDVVAEHFVLRLGGANTELLGIDRAAECAAARAAASAGLGPEVVHVIEPEGYLVTRFVAGSPVSPDEMRRPETIVEVGALLRRVHTLPPVSSAFSPFRVVESYRQLAASSGMPALPAGLDPLFTHVRAMEAALAAAPAVPCLCHNDLINGNFLRDAATGALLLLDWEYAGMGDPFFDLANVAAQHEFSDEHDQALLTAYFGAVAPPALARLKLMKLMSDLREAMWGVAQQCLSELDFDFEGYTAKYFARFRAGVQQADVPAWLNLVVAADPTSGA